MAKNLLRAGLPALLLILVLGPGQSRSLFAQESSLAVVPASAAEPAPASLVEIASADPVLLAPGNTATFASAPIPSGAPMAFVPVAVETKSRVPHPFWDRENRALFAAVGASAAADFCATRANLAIGGRELNPMTRVLSGSTPGLAANFTLETGSVIAVSYLFHKTGHHRLERITAIVNIGASATAAGYSFAHH